MAFLKKRLAASETVGTYFHDLMRERSVNVSQLASALQLQEKHVRALLAGDASQLPGAYYSAHLVRLIAGYLQGNVGYALRLFERISSPDAHTEAPETVFDKTQIRGVQFMVFARVLAGLALFSVLGGVFVYFGRNIQHALTPPDVVVFSPIGDVVTSERALVVEGKTEPEVSLRVNGELVVTDREGAFSVPLYLDDGLNVVEVRAAKRYSKDQIVYRRVLVEQKALSAR